MMKLREVLLPILIGIATIGSLGMFLWEWPTSPLHKGIAWHQLRTGSFASVENGQHALTLLYGEAPNQTALQKKSLGLTITETIVETKEVALPFTVETSTDPTFPAEWEYTFPAGHDGFAEVEVREVQVNGKITAYYDHSTRILTPPLHEKRFIGEKVHAELTKQLTDNWNSLKTALSKKQQNTAETYLLATDFGTLASIFKISDLAYRLEHTASVSLALGGESEFLIQVGTVTLQQKNCTTKATIPLYYLKDQQQYRLGNVLTALQSLCAKPKPTSGVLSCKNCWLAPVSKKFALPSTYIPYVVATGVTGGGYVTPDTRTALQKLFADAKANGISVMRVSSSYRSYTTQQSLFNSYVNNERKKGLTYEQAVVKANTYSAKPGHSEHQLGTTVDIMGCNYPCNFYDSKNTPVYTYLHNNAHKFGFIISYPNGSEPYTGYTYEPWHIRYIGVTRAQELYNRGYLTKTGYYLQQYLSEKGEY